MREKRIDVPACVRASATGGYRNCFGTSPRLSEVTYTAAATGQNTNCLRNGSVHNPPKTGRPRLSRGPGTRRLASFPVGGFTLIELMIVVLILAILVGIAVPVYLNMQKKVRDNQRLANMKTIEGALTQYRNQYGEYPPSDYQGPGGWDDAADGDFISYLKNRGCLKQDVTDPSNGANIRYYRYNAGAYGANPAYGRYYVLGVVDMETQGRPAQGSHGWNTPGRNWQNEFDWVTGQYENW